MPYAAKNANGISTGYTVRNVSSGEVTVQAIYYNQNGTRLTDADETFTLLPAQVRGNAQILNGGLPNPPQSWQGSIVLQATGDIVAMMRADDDVSTQSLFFFLSLPTVTPLTAQDPRAVYCHRQKKRLQ